jgi:hypothetical protein
MGFFDSHTGPARGGNDRDGPDLPLVDRGLVAHHTERIVIRISEFLLEDPFPARAVETPRAPPAFARTPALGRFEDRLPKIAFRQRVPGLARSRRAEQGVDQLLISEFPDDSRGEGRGSWWMGGIKFHGCHASSLW